MAKYKIWAILVAFSLISGGCGSSQVNPQIAFEDVQTDLAKRVNEKPVWHIDDEARKAAAERVRGMLADELTCEEAIRIAMLNNYRLQATYERLGIAQARVVQAGLLPNPMFDASVRFVEGPRSDYILEMGALQNIMELLLIPLKKRLSKAQLEVAKSEVVGIVLDVVAQVRIAYVTLQSAEQTLSLNEQILAATEASYDAARRLHEAGNITDLALANERALYEQSKLNVASAELAVMQRHEKMNTLMGLWGRKTSWKIEGDLPDIPEDLLHLHDLERRVVKNSLDLKIIRKRMMVVAERIGIDTSKLVFPELAAGAEAEREPDGTWSVGPTFGIGIPLFDQGVARKAAGSAELKRLWNEYTAMSVELRSLSRAARYRLLNARRQNQYYRTVIVPLAEQITGETQLRYNAMQLGVFQLLAAKQREIDTRRRAISALENYWVARVELDLLLDGRMKGQTINASGGGGMSMPQREGGH